MFLDCRKMYLHLSWFSGGGLPHPLKYIARPSSSKIKYKQMLLTPFKCTPQIIFVVMT